MPRMKNTDLEPSDAAAALLSPEHGNQFAPTSDEIAVLAYSFWQTRNSPSGSPEEDWFRAEQHIEHCRTPGSAL